MALRRERGATAQGESQHVSREVDPAPVEWAHALAPFSGRRGMQNTLKNCAPQSGIAIGAGACRAAGYLWQKLDLPQRLLKRFRRLGAFDQVLVVHDYGRHGGNAPLLPVAFPLAHDGCELVAAGDGPRPLRVQADCAGQLDENVRGTRVAAFAVIGAQQRPLEFQAATLEPRPVQHPVRVEGVPDVFARPEGEADGGPALAYPRLGLCNLLRGAAVLAHEVRDCLRAVGAHVRVQLEGLEVQCHRHLGSEARERLLEGCEADGTPGAGHVGYEGDVQRLSFHGKEG